LYVVFIVALGWIEGHQIEAYNHAGNDNIANTIDIKLFGHCVSLSLDQQIRHDAVITVNRREAGQDPTSF
jgi:hypothetical protein